MLLEIYEIDHQVVSKFISSLMAIYKNGDEILQTSKLNTRGNLQNGHYILGTSDANASRNLRKWSSNFAKI